VRWACLLVLVAACGRLRFDPPGGHDEDGDGIPDVEDPCPHVAGDYADRDGDGVGDACDPNPDAPTESFLIFATMQPGDQPFDDASGFTQEADDLETATNLYPNITRVLGTARVDIGFEIRGIVGTGQHQIAAGIQDSAAITYYFDEINDDPPTRDVGITSFSQATGYVPLAMVDPGPMHPGTGILRIDAVTSPPHHALVAGWTDQTGQLYQTSAATPDYAGGQLIRVAFNGLDVAIRYVVVIVTSP
jgi:hypothetical protein